MVLLKEIFKNIRFEKIGRRQKNCRLLITFANSLDPDQARPYGRAWSGSTLFDTLMVLLKEIFKNIRFEKIGRRQKRCRLLITFANSLDPDQARPYGRAWSGSKLFDTLMVLLKEMFKNISFEKKQQTTKGLKYNTAFQEIIRMSCSLTERYCCFWASMSCGKRTVKPVLSGPLK